MVEQVRHVPAPALVHEGVQVIGHLLGLALAEAAFTSRPPFSPSFLLALAGIGILRRWWYTRYCGITWYLLML